LKPEVRKERTGWRDLSLSQRHRRWGWDCPAVDLDFLFLEYDKGKAVALVEYKHEQAAPQYRTHPTYQAMIDLSDRACVPCFACRYANDFSWFKIHALNRIAENFLPEKQKDMTEKEWVTFLYKIRGYDVPEDLFTDMGISI
jgi:hypothetical protein